MIHINGNDFLRFFKETLELNVEAYSRIITHLKPDMSEQDLHTLIAQAYREKAGRPIAVFGDILTGERTSLIGGDATTRQMKKGDVIIADLLPENNGVFVDTTRTFFMGEPNKKQADAYYAVCRALRAGEQSLHAGVSGEDIFHAVSHSLEESGYLPLVHHAGHGVGLSRCEAPHFIEDSQQRLSVGMVVTLEPGIYIPDAFGIRIENNYLITEDGFELLFHYTTQLEEVIIL